MDTSFTNHWDVLPPGRLKFAHGVAAICPFKIDISSKSRYTGILKPGTVHGLMRLGTGSDITSKSDPGMTPGAAMKFLRSGTYSANALFSYSTMPVKEKTFDFFGYPLSNHALVRKPEGHHLGRVLGAVMTGVKYCETKSCVSKVGISDLTFYDQAGNFVKKPKFPYRFS